MKAGSCLSVTPSRSRKLDRVLLPGAGSQIQAAASIQGPFQADAASAVSGVQSITALAHLRAAVLYIVDISEQCGYTIAQQAALFHSIRPLFSNKPLLIVANKTDAIRPEALPDADKAILADMGRAAAQASNPGMILPL